MQLPWRCLKRQPSPGIIDLLVCCTFGFVYTYQRNAKPDRVCDRQKAVGCVHAECRSGWEREGNTYWFQTNIFFLIKSLDSFCSALCSVWHTHTLSLSLSPQVSSYTSLSPSLMKLKMNWSTLGGFPLSLTTLPLIILRSTLHPYTTHV